MTQSINHTLTWHKIEGGKEPQNFVVYLVYVENKDGSIFGYQLAYCYKIDGGERIWVLQNDLTNKGMGGFWIKYFAEIPDLRSTLYDGNEPDRDRQDSHDD